MLIAYSFSILIMILLPVGLAILLRRRFRVPWLLFAIGTVTFIGSQVVHLPLNSLLSRVGWLPKDGMLSTGIPLLQTALILGFTAGLCEELARTVGYALLKKNHSLEDGLMLGLGHGGIESMIFGGVLTAAMVSSLVSYLNVDLSTLKLTADQLFNAQQQLDTFRTDPITKAFLPLVERMIAMTAHVLFSLIVLQAFRKRNAIYVAIAILYHMTVDTVAVLAATRLASPWYFELAFIGLLIPGVAFLVLLWRKETLPSKPKRTRMGSEIALFWVSLRKELLQLWRTKRVLVVFAVFLLFGMTSPLLAYFMPQMFKGFAQLEQFADLIPTPTTIDAVNQYIKNITQFGFLLAVLLGMNSVAGEKESGTATMILSKPMPRWAFISSKFAAQALLYLAAFILSGLGAYLYTVLLFGNFGFAKFLLANGLMFEWMLIFVAAALVGSVIGTTTASAAGVGIGISVILLLLGSIPQYGQLLPNGLIGWASQMFTDSSEMMINGGAVAGGLVLIVLGIVWSISLFERQEI